MFLLVLLISCLFLYLFELGCRPWEWERKKRFDGEALAACAECRGQRKWRGIVTSASMAVVLCLAFWRLAS